MLNYTDLKPGTNIVLNNEPYLVLSFNFIRKQKRQPTVQTKLKSLVSGQVIEKSFQPSDKIEEAVLDFKKVKFLYAHRGEFWFSEEDNPRSRFKLEEKVIASAAKYLKENLTLEVVIFRDKIINIKLPIKVDLKVIESPPGVRGNTAQGGVKQVKLETGMILNVPLFINEGDIVRVNTETGEYVGRVLKGGDKL